MSQLIHVSRPSAGLLDMVSIVANKVTCLNKLVYFSCTKCNRTVVFTHWDKEINTNR